MVTEVTTFDGNDADINPLQSKGASPRSKTLTSPLGSADNEVLLTLSNVGWHKNITIWAFGTVRHEISYDGETWTSGPFWRKGTASGYSYTGPAALDAGLFFIGAGIGMSFPYHRFIQDSASASRVRVHLVG